MATTFKMVSDSLKIRRLELPSPAGSLNESGSSTTSTSLDNSESSSSSGSSSNIPSSPDRQVPKSENGDDSDDLKVIGNDDPEGGGGEGEGEEGSESDDSDSPTPEGQYEVEQILDYSRDDRGDWYCVKWKNWDHDFNTWEPPRNLVNCESIMLEFYLARKAAYEKALSETEYVTTANGRKRRRGPTPPQVPPDPRPVSVQIEEFFIKDGAMTEAEIDECQKRLAGKKKLETRPLNTKLTKMLQQALNDQLDADNCIRVRKQLLENEFIRRKASHNNTLKLWEDDINAVSQGKPTISIENDVDWEGPPPNFTYINDYLATSGIVIPDDPPCGCDCKFNCQDKSGCCAANAGVNFAYNSFGRLKVGVGTPIYECNKKCKCDTTCHNRVVQDGHNPNMHFTIFRTSNGRGWGVKSMKTIKKGTFVTLYVGEVINTEEAERRGKSYDEEGITYLFDLDFNEGESCPYTVDAAQYGNVAHFINHSCDPNLGVFAVWVNCLDPNLPKLALFAIQDISKGEEITFDYMNLVIDHQVKQTKLCKCESKNCRKYLF